MIRIIKDSNISYRKWFNSESYFQQSENFVEKKDSVLWKNKANITLSLKTAFISFSAKELTHPLCPRITKLCPNIIVILMQVSVNFRLQMTKKPLSITINDVTAKDSWITHTAEGFQQKDQDNINKKTATV